MSNEKTINFTFNFNAPVGQNIAHVEKLEAHFDKDMTMQVVDTKSIVNDEQEEERGAEKTHGNECKDILKECFEKERNSQLHIDVSEVVKENM
ncbi:MAG: hypothetical protein J6R91_06180 [Bacteroidaceae bacterium]|nr:hypothetical protein [Bacteroidaceae bacterium]